jgi:hypothetical protein
VIQIPANIASWAPFPRLATFLGSSTMVSHLEFDNGHEVIETVSQTTNVILPMFTDHPLAKEIP